MILPFSFESQIQKHGTGLGFYQLDREMALEKVPAGYRLNIGPFNVIGTTQMFNIISGMIEASGQYKTSINFSEGRRILNVEGQKVKIILCPAEGLVFEGNKQKIDVILQMAKKAVVADLENLASSS